MNRVQLPVYLHDPKNVATKAVLWGIVDKEAREKPQQSGEEKLSVASVGEWETRFIVYVQRYKSAKHLFANGQISTQFTYKNYTIMDPREITEWCLKRPPYPMVTDFNQSNLFSGSLEKPLQQHQHEGVVVSSDSNHTKSVAPTTFAPLKNLFAIEFVNPHWFNSEWLHNLLKSGEVLTESHLRQAVPPGVSHFLFLHQVLPHLSSDERSLIFLTNMKFLQSEIQLYSNHLNKQVISLHQIHYHEKRTATANARCQASEIICGAQIRGTSSSSSSSSAAQKRKSEFEMVPVDAFDMILPYFFLLNQK